MNALRTMRNGLPLARVDVVEHGIRARSRRVPCIIGRDISFSTERLESYCLTHWEPLAFDALLLAGAVEFCDKTLRRPIQTWARRFELQIPVHDPDRWNAKPVLDGLHAALEFLMGDQWAISFVPRDEPVSAPRQLHFDLPEATSAVIPFSDGLDSRAVAGLMERELGDKLIRVRLGAKSFDAPARISGADKKPFTSIPYGVPLKKDQSVESSARSRGFKYSLMSGLAAYLVKAHRIIVPESGQGSLAPGLIAVGQAYEDYRNHPLFTDLMEKFLIALLGHEARFEFPQLWKTKGETLAQFVKECVDGPSWVNTWSCWQGNRQASVGGRRRQCGICAACMLRRLSVHAANLKEPKEFYIWEDLSASTFQAGAVAGFKRFTNALREYAIAGVLHLDHLASFQHSATNKSTIDLAAFNLSQSLDLTIEDARMKLSRLLSQHEDEWRRFLKSLGNDSFVAHWTV